MRKSKSNTTQSRLIRAGLATGAAVVTVLGATATPAFAEPKLTLSASSGPDSGGNTITAQAPAGITPFLSSTAPSVQFQAITASVTACSVAYKQAETTIAGSGITLTAGTVNNDAASSVKRISSSRIIVTVDAALDLPANTTLARFNMCAYDGTGVSSVLLASAPYSIAAAPTVSNVTPTSGPALGGYQITISGANFSTGSTVTLGGVALTNVVIGAGGTSITGTAPARPAGTSLPLVITSTGGSVTTSGLNLFSLSNGIVVTPNTAPTNTTPPLDVMGVGFSGMTFADAAITTGTSVTAHVGLVTGAYNDTTNRMLTLCYDVTVLTDNELVCTLDLGDQLDPTTADVAGSGVDVPAGTYTVTVVRNGASAIADALHDATAITSGSTFTVAEY